MSCHFTLYIFLYGRHLISFECELEKKTIFNPDRDNDRFQSKLGFFFLPGGFSSRGERQKDYRTEKKIKEKRDRLVLTRFPKLRHYTVRITDLYKLNLVEILNSCLVLGSSQFPLVPCCLKICRWLQIS